MTPPLKSASSHSPRLSPDARIHRHNYRGVPWYIVHDRMTGRSVHLSEGAWRIVGAMDGERTINDIRSVVSQRDPDVSEEQIRSVCAQLLAAGLLDQVGAASTNSSSSMLARWLASPLSIRVPLIDPKRWLDATHASLQPVFSRNGLLVWLLTVLVAIAFALNGQSAIEAQLMSTTISPFGVLLFVAVYVVMKLVHELAHAYAIRSFGGTVREMGLVFLVFMPVPYVDASSSIVFERKRERMLVSAAGIMAEVFMSALALLIWLHIEPGLLREICFAMVMIGGVSTLLFNGNPLLKFDGYYVLCDALETPNLASRSKRCLRACLEHRLLGLPATVRNEDTGSVRGWLLAYGVLSSLYRVLVLALIVWFVSRHVPVVGYALAGWVVVSQLLRPLFATCVAVWKAARQASNGPIVLARFGSALACLALVIFVLPFPAWAGAEGVIWLSPDGQLKAPTDGTVVARHAVDDGQVAAQQLILSLQAPRLDVEIRERARLVDEIKARHGRALMHDRGRLRALESELRAARQALASVREQRAALSVHSPASGRLHLVSPRALDGRHVRKGDLLGFVRDNGPPVARAVVRQTEIDRLRRAGTTVRVRIPGLGSEVFEAQVVDAVGAATNELPSVALGSAGGGRIATDARNETLRRAAEDVFIVDVALAPDTPPVAAGTRVYLRFDFPSQPLGRQLLNAVRRLTLGHQQA